MKIAIIGSGDVGQALAKGLIASGHSVMIGTRNTRKKDLKWTKEHKEKLSVGSFVEAADFGQIAILAVAWHASENVLSLIRPEVTGKIIIDVTNPIRFNDDDDDEAPELVLGHDISAGEMVQQSLSDSHVIKTLNFISYENMVNPVYAEGTPTMFLCGNNDSAKKSVRELLAGIGWSDVHDIGGIEKSRLLEPLSLLWIEYGSENGTWNHAISFLSE